MTLLRTNSKAFWRALNGRRVDGDPLFAVGQWINVGLVSLPQGDHPSSVRSDSSGSLGRAEDRVVVGVLLIPPDVPVRIGDNLAIEGMELRVKSVQPKRGLRGSLDHWEVEIEQGRGDV